MFQRILFLIWFVPVVIHGLMSLFEYAFDRDASGTLFLKRLGLLAIWPLAALSKRGRDILFSNTPGVF